VTDARFSVQAIHDGTDIAVVDASPEDIAADDGFAMRHDDAVRLAKKSAAELGCRWFDMSTFEVADRRGLTP
jgi:hypothetical protein